MDAESYEAVVGKAAVRDASWFDQPRHDGVGGHRPGSWAPKYHVIAPDGERGRWWSACGTAFLLADAVEEPEGVREHARCQRNGCRQRWLKRADTPRPEGGERA